MIDRLDPHLTDETLNEYLDGALGGAPRSAAESHLQGCAACSSRLAALSAVFAGLESLPPSPLQRDLGPGVMAAVRAKTPIRPRIVADTRRPAFQLVFASQALLALTLLAFAWPFLAGLALPLLAAGDLGSLAARLAAAWLDPNGLWTAAQGWLASATVQPALLPVTFLQPAAAGPLFAMTGLFWLLGNALLLRPRPTPKPRSPS